MEMMALLMTVTKVVQLYNYGNDRPGPSLSSRVIMVDYYTLARGIMGLMLPRGHQVQPKGRRPEGCTWCPRAASNP